MSIELLKTDAIKTLARHAIKGTVPKTENNNFSTEDVNEALRDQFRLMCKSINDFKRNQYDIFAIIMENADEIVPVQVESAISAFAEVKNVGQNVKALFKTNLGKGRARKFITQVALSGVYESFRLDTSTYEIRVEAIGGAVSIDFERVLDGSDNMMDLMNILTDGLINAVYVEIQRALIASVKSQRPTKNKVVASSFDREKMFDLASTVKAYGGSGIGRGPGSAIFATPQFIGAMGIDNMGDLNGGTGINPGQAQIDEIYTTGYVSLFRGIPLVEIPQSFTDDNNDTFTMRPDLAYVLPTGGEKVVKVVFEGNTQVWSTDNIDQSIEINTYKKLGVGIQTFHNWGIYQNTALTTKYANEIAGNKNLTMPA